jgi:flagellar motor switch protein FliM
MNLKIGDVEGLMNVCLPYTTLEPVMDKLNTKYWFANMQEKGGETFEKEIEGMIRRSEIPIKAVLGKSKISVADFVTLQYGDIIRLNKKVDQELDVYVGNIKKFKALPGYFEDKYAVRVTEVYREEEG